MKDINLIKVNRLKKGWTQVQLAEITGLSERTIQRLENGAKASIESINALATVFEVDLKSLEPVKLREHFSAPINTKLLMAAVSLWVLIMIIEFLSIGSPFLSIIIATLLYVFFSIHGYSIINNQLLIHRVGWSSRYDLNSLSSIDVNPFAMTGAIRIFGASLLFVSVGKFKNSIIGKFTAYTTNPDNCLVLRFSDEVVVITPDDPEAMQITIEEHLGNIET